MQQVSRYEAFNPVLSSFTWGNSATFSQAFSSDGVISSITASNAYPVNKSYTYDSRYNITAITEAGNTSRTSSATYSNMSRISNYTYGTSGNTNDYTYNTSEDRASQKLNSGTATTYNYDSSSHKLTSLSGGSTDSMAYDANGNILTAIGQTYTYNAANRMLTSNDGTTTTNYLINFMGQRTKKSNSSATTWFIYDENDNVIAEYDAAGNLVDEYIYVDSRPLALVRSSNLYYIYTDHLNTLRAITDISNNLQWTWENKEAFGNNLPVETIGGSTFKFNFRLPGQYFDSEKNLNYNMHRDYNPVWGRYMQSDPLGLAAGINTYGYTLLNPLKYIDPTGLLPVEYYLKLWICSSQNWDEAFSKAQSQKRGPFDPNDNRTSAEHYIIGRAMGKGNVGRGVQAIYMALGGYSSIIWQGIKYLQLSPKSSPTSMTQAYWESAAYTDFIMLTNHFSGSPGQCNCKAESSK